MQDIQSQVLSIRDDGVVLRLFNRETGSAKPLRCQFVLDVPQQLLTYLVQKIGQLDLK